MFDYTQQNFMIFFLKKKKLYDILSKKINYDMSPKKNYDMSVHQ